MDNRIYNWLFFLMNPFAAMIIAFKDYQFSYAKNIFWAFCTFYGLTFAIGKESESSDINRYLGQLQSLYIQHELTVSQAIQQFVNSGEIDVFQNGITYILSRFTDSQAVLTMVYAFIFGFFFSRNIWYVFGLLKGRLDFITKFIIFALILVVPIWNINGVRMYLAFHVFMYGLLPFIFENKKNKLIFIPLSFFVHFSYIVPILLFALYLLIGNRLYIYFFIFLFSIFVSEFEVRQFNDIVDNFAPQALAERSQGYRNEAVVEEYRETIIDKNVIWYVVWFQRGLRWSLIVILIYFILFANMRIRILPVWKRLFSLSLMYFTIANFLSHLPSGGRFYIFTFFLTMIMIILYINQFKKDDKFLLLSQLLSPAFLLFIIVSIRLGFYSISVSTIMGNPLIAIFTASETVSLNDLIK